MTLEDRFEKHPWLTGGNVVLKAAAAVLLVGVVVIILAFALGWFSAAVSVPSASNVRAQYRFGYEYDRALAAEARNVCVGERRHLDPEALAAYEQTYSNTQGQYDAAMADAFRAKHVKPPDLPSVAPSLSERVAALKAEGAC